MRNPEPADATLLRDDVSSQFRVIRCAVQTDVSPDLRHAEYCFHYILRRTSPGPNTWREVFPHPPNEIQMGVAQPGPPAEGGGAHHGLSHSVTALPGGNECSCLIVEFHRSVPLGGEYEFHYRCRTRIESAQSRSFFGSRGAVWFWSAHEFPVEESVIALTLPRGSKVGATHPPARSAPETEPGRAKPRPRLLFEHHNLAPSEFAVGLVSVELPRFGLPVRYARTFEVIGAFLLGVTSSLVASALFELFSGAQP